jgi:prenyltransferase beta subunit
MLPLAGWLALFALPLQGGEPPPLDDAAILKRVGGAIDKALARLAKSQYPDGSWPSGYGGNGRNQGVNGVAILSFLGRGHHPDRGPYRDNLTRARKFVLGSQNAAGLYVSPNQSHGPMYEHALATLAMVEMLGMANDPKHDASVRKAVQLIVRCQSENGGWRYQPHPGDADISVTVMEIVALRAARNAGLEVPQKTLDKAMKYVRDCAHQQGGFGYQPGNGPGPARTAAGILSCQLAGDPGAKEIPPALKFLASEPITWGGEWFYYTHYYAIQAHYQAGGDAWNQWHPKIRELLLSKQSPDGTWPIPPGCQENQTANKDNVYPTAMACLVLEVYLHLLPAYQR